VHRAIILAAFLLVALVFPISGAAGSPTSPREMPPPLNCKPATAALAAIPTIQFASVPNPADVNALVTFCSQVNGAPGSYSLNWSFGDGAHSSAADPTHIYRTVANYTATLVYNSSSYNISFNFTVYVNPAVRASAMFSPTHPSTSTTVFFNATPSSGTPPYVTFWNFSGRTTATGDSVSEKFSSAGTYLVRVWSNDSGGGSAFNEFNVTVAGTGGNSFPGGNIGILIGTSAAAVAVGLGGFAYLQYDKRRRPKLPTTAPPPPS
jgi:PKD domain-containing protein